MAQHIHLLLIGPPGSGKGTQATRICQRYSIPMISTGDILRAAVKAGTGLGHQVQDTLASGGLVGDELMVNLVRDRLAQPDTAHGFVLDGFPRTTVQALALDTLASAAMLQAIVLEVPESELERRLTSRRICSKCKALTTSGSLYGSEEELCSRCGSTLITRDDDNMTTIRNRLLTYRLMAEPLIAHYRDRSVLAVVDGTRAADDVTQTIFGHIDSFGKRRKTR